MSDKAEIHVHRDAKQLRDTMQRLREAGKTPAMDVAEAMRAAERLAALPPSPRKPWYRKLWPFDIERASVVLIAIFVAWIAIDHHRLVNIRVEAMKCRDGAKPSQTAPK